MENKTARLITTFNCKRECSYCCNKYKHIIDQGVHISDLTELKELKDYPVICITGGEPMLDPIWTQDIIKFLRKRNRDVIIYLYSAWYGNNWLPEIAPFIDGLRFTLHEKTKKKDLLDFYVLQEDIERFGEKKSYRLYIHYLLPVSVEIVPRLWNRVEVKPWIGEKDCELPKNETLFILKH